NDADGSLLGPVSEMCLGLSLLVTGAMRRLGFDAYQESTAAGTSLHLLDIAVDRVVRGVGSDLHGPVNTVEGILYEEIIPRIAQIVMLVVGRLPTLPVEGRGTRTSFNPSPARELPLPAWLPPSRILGGFYVVRPLA